nr:MAG TPA: hypothetical protein [Caudoviricetes sp.]
MSNRQRLPLSEMFLRPFWWGVNISLFCMSQYLDNLTVFDDHHVCVKVAAAPHSVSYSFLQISIGFHIITAINNNATRIFFNLFQSTTHSTVNGLFGRNALQFPLFLIPQVIRLLFSTKVFL